MPRGLKAGNLAALAVGVLIGAALLEVGIRVLFPPPAPPPHIVRNEIGFRDSDHPLDKPEGLVRIAFIGDSYTFGQGVARGDRFSERVAEQLDDGYRDASVEMLKGAALHFRSGHRGLRLRPQRLCRPPALQDRLYTSGG